MKKPSAHQHRRTALKGISGLAVAPALIGSARAQGRVRWKLQSHLPKSSVSFQGSLGVLADELEKRTDGRFTLELLGAGELAKGGEIFNFVRRGVVPMGSTSSTYNLGESELAGFYYGIPGAFRDAWEMALFTKQFGLEEAINDELRPKGVFYMADKSVSTELVLKRELSDDTNLGGIKIRSSGILVDFLGAAGFMPQAIAGPELYQALATGVVDGAHWGGPAGAMSMKLWEVAPVHMRQSLVISNETYVINVKAYEALPDDLRAIFRTLLEERFYARTMETKLARFDEASKVVLEKEMEKGDRARRIGEKLIEFRKELGHA